MDIIETVEVDGRSGDVFFDDDWDAYGWKTSDFCNGPFSTPEEAREALLEELETVEWEA